MKLDLSNLLASKRRKEPPYGGWDYNKTSCAVITCRSGEGAVLWWVGGHIDFEIVEGGVSSLADLGLDNAPEGICVWEGVYVYHSDDSYFHNDGGWTEAVGEFRTPTDEEWEWIQSNRCPWDANDWMEKEFMRATVGRIVHYRALPRECELWASEISPVTADTVLAAMVIKAQVKGEDHLVNLRVFLDGEHDAYVSCAGQGDGPGKWNWPPRV